MLERDILELLRFIFEEKKDFENFVNKIFNDKIDIIQEKYKSEIVVNKILIKLSYIHLDLFKK